MIQLTDEEIEELLGIDFKTAYSGHIAEYQEVAKAQLKKVGGQLADEWNETESDSSSMRDFVNGFIQTLLEEVAN